MSREDILDALRQQVQKLEQSNCSNNDEQTSSNRNTALVSEYLDNKEECVPHAHSSACDSEPSKKRDAFSKIVAMINASEKSSTAIRKRLVRSGYEENEIDDALGYAINCGLIDDMRYAHILIQSRIRQGWGRNGIERELCRNGIDASLIEGWPYDYPLSEDDQFERALTYLRRKPPRSKNLRESAYRKLIQKGYSSSLASQVARIWVSEATVQ